MPPSTQDKSAPRAYFLWSDSELTVGLKRYDQEHQHLGELINQIHQAALERRDRNLCFALLDRFQQQARNHFDSEEAALQETGYPELTGHSEEHTRLLSTLRDMQQRYQAGGQSALILVDFLRTWLVQHIKVSDRKYTTHLRKHGYR